MRLKPYIAIARPDYWTNHVFILPGVFLAFMFAPAMLRPGVAGSLIAAVAAACLVASSNYVLNEILDAARDRFHPEKCNRPVARGDIDLRIAYAEWLLLAVLGVLLALRVNTPLAAALVLLWLAGTAYNVPPLRLKDIPYVDVLSESLNNPIRMAIGWYATGTRDLPPFSVLLAYWMFGAFLMTMKRFAEFRHIRASGQAGNYRTSFRHYSEERLIECLVFYGSLFGMLSGFFMARYDVELALATPVVAYAMAYYMNLGFRPDSPVQHPERLYRQRKLVLLVALAFVLCCALLFIRVPGMERLLR